MYHGPLQEIKEEIPMTDKPNIQRITERINRCENPKRTLAALCAILAITQNRNDLTPNAIRDILEDQHTKETA